MNLESSDCKCLVCDFKCDDLEEMKSHVSTHWREVKQEVVNLNANAPAYPCQKEGKSMYGLTKRELFALELTKLFPYSEGEEYRRNAVRQSILWADELLRQLEE